MPNNSRQIRLSLLRPRHLKSRHRFASARRAVASNTASGRSLQSYAALAKQLRRSSAAIAVGVLMLLAAWQPMLAPDATIATASAASGSGGPASQDGVVLASDPAAAGDRAALEAFYHATRGESWDSARNWLTDRPLGEWQGVVTGINGRVEMLILSENGLDGPLPSAMAGLTRLRALGLGGNRLRGPIPPEFADLAALTSLDLSGNEIGGQIPIEFANLAALEYLDLSGNRLSGRVPAELANLASLADLDLSRNRLSGPLPAELFQAPRLRFLDLAGNRLTGLLPAAIAGAPELARLDLDSNELNGSLPPQIWEIENLVDLDLSHNHFSGPIPPPRIDSRLRRLDLGSNQLSGPIPDEIGEVAFLSRLTLPYNQLTGPVPAALGDLKNLQVLYLGSNQLTGPIPDSLGGAARIEQLDLARNRLTGTLPASLGLLANLKSLWLNQNSLSGPIHPSLHRLGKLEAVYLGPGNRFEGCVPSHWPRVEHSGSFLKEAPGCPAGLSDLAVGGATLSPGFGPEIEHYLLWHTDAADAIALQASPNGGEIKVHGAAGREMPFHDAASVYWLQDPADAGPFVLWINSEGAQRARSYTLQPREAFPGPLLVSGGESIGPSPEEGNYFVPNLRFPGGEADFLGYYRRSGGLERWGIPLSPVQLSEPGRLTQWFQRGAIDFNRTADGWRFSARLHWDDSGRPLHPRLRAIGTAAESGQPGIVVENTAADGTATGFADFYRRLGGEAVLGRPLSGARRDWDPGISGGALAPGFIRQYFQAGVLELHPWDAAAPVKLALIGAALAPASPEPAREAAPARGSRFEPGLAFLDGKPARPRSAPDPPTARQRLAGSVLLEVQPFDVATDEYLTWTGDPIDAATVSQILFHAGFDNLAGDLPLDYTETVETRLLGPQGEVIHQEHRGLGDALPGIGYVSAWYFGRHSFVADLPGLGRYRLQTLLDEELIAQVEFELIRRKSPDIQPAADELARTVPWMQDPLHRDAVQGRQLLADLHRLDPAAAAAAVKLPWLQDPAASSDFLPLAKAAALGAVDGSDATGLLASGWIADGLSESERMLLAAFPSIAPGLRGALLAGLARTGSLDDWEEHHSRIFSDLRHLSDESRIAALADAAWIRDGLDRGELRLLAALAGPHFDTGRELDLAEELAAAPSSTSRRITTGRSADVLLTVIGRDLTEVGLGLGPLDAAEFALRSIETHLGVAWPFSDAAVIIDPDVSSRVGGFYTPDFMAVNVFFGNPDSTMNILAHELAHSYFHGLGEPEWMEEGAPTYLDFHVRWDLGWLDLPTWRQITEGEFAEACQAANVTTINALHAALAQMRESGEDSPEIWGCRYDMGSLFLRQLREVMGAYNLGSVLGAVHSAARASGEDIDESVAYNAFLKRAPSGSEDELVRLLAELYGDPVPV